MILPLLAVPVVIKDHHHLFWLRLRKDSPNYLPVEDRQTSWSIDLMSYHIDYQCQESLSVSSDFSGIKVENHLIDVLLASFAEMSELSDDKEKHLFAYVVTTTQLTSDHPWW